MNVHELLTTHPFEVGPSQRAHDLPRRPYLLLSFGGEPHERRDGSLYYDAPSVVLIKEGQYYYDNGQQIDEAALPDWFWAAARKCSPEARMSVRLVLPEEREPPAPTPPPRAKRPRAVKGEG